MKLGKLNRRKFRRSLVAGEGLWGLFGPCLNQRDCRFISPVFYTPRFQSVTRLALGAALLGTAELTLQAQDALRGSVEEDRAYHGRQTQDTEPYKLRAGPIKFSADFSVAVELNDNANLLPSTRGTNAEDVILRPLWQFNGIFPVTQESRISFGVGVGYQKYFRYHERDRAYVRPNSELAYDLVARDTVITFYDRFLYDQEVTAASNLGGATNFLPRFDNTIGEIGRAHV